MINFDHLRLIFLIFMEDTKIGIFITYKTSKIKCLKLSNQKKSVQNKNSSNKNKTVWTKMTQIKIFYPHKNNKLNSSKKKYLENFKIWRIFKNKWKREELNNKLMKKNKKIHLWSRKHMSIDSLKRSMLKVGIWR